VDTPPGSRPASLTGFARRLGALAACCGVLAQLAGCLQVPFEVEVEKPALIGQQTRQAAGLAAGRSTRDDVRTALGVPWLQSDYWGFDIYRVSDSSRRLVGIGVPVLPVPFGVFAAQEEGYVLIAYDGQRRVTEIGQGRFRIHDRPPWIFERISAGRFIFGLEGMHVHTLPVLTADAAALEHYVEAVRGAGACVAVLACEGAARGGSQWADSACPDEVTVAEQRIDLRPFRTLCGPGAGNRCPSGAAPVDDATLEVMTPLVLPAGRHLLSLRSSFLLGRREIEFECAAREVRYGVVEAWEDSSAPTRGVGSLRTELVFHETLPAAWHARRLVLHRGGRWLVAEEPGSP